MSVPYQEGPGPGRTLVTVGHGTATREQLRHLLLAAGVNAVVDVRRFPGSRRHPHVASGELETWLPAAGIGYRWEPRLGGRRRVSPEADASDPWWAVAAFRAYAAHTRTPEFRAAVDTLLSGTGTGTAGAPTTALMCSESLWWRCHRRLIADVLVLLHDVEVHHLSHDGRLTAHRPAAGARVGDGHLVYDRMA